MTGNRELPIYLRAHTIELAEKHAKRKKARDKTRKWPFQVLIIDCETTIDTSQALTFGCARYCKQNAYGVYECSEEILFYADDLENEKPAAINTLRQYAKEHQADSEYGNNLIRVLSRAKFIEEFFWPLLLELDGIIVCFNAPFDLSRLAVNCTNARYGESVWSLVMSEDFDPETGKKRNNPMRPRVKITPKDSQAAFIKLSGISVKGKISGKRLFHFVPGRFLDLKTLGWSLRNVSYSLERACKSFGIEGKLDHKPTGLITKGEINYCRQDVRCTEALLREMRREFDLHPLDVMPDRVFSPASIVKAYKRAMGIRPPITKFNLPEEAQGIAMQSYYGGQTECRIRHTEVPIVVTDLTSEYPSVNALMRLWDVFTAKQLHWVEATQEIRTFMNSLTLEMVFAPNNWPQFRFFALLEPNQDFLPVRSAYNGTNTNIGINQLTSENPIWYAGPDVVAAWIRSGKCPNIIRAFHIVPEGRQNGLKTVRLRGEVAINPRKDDFYKRIIERRAEAKKNGQDSLAGSLKVTANAGSYGLSVEINQSKSKGRKRFAISVYSGDTKFTTTSEILEKAGIWYFPVVGSLITAAGRLMLGLIEYCVHKRGGSYLFCDTDSMAIVASEKGGLVPCPGGAYKFNGADAIKALTWRDVEEIRDEIDRLNPYDRTSVKDSILKIEKVNFKNNVQQQLFGFSISSKRYAIYSVEQNQINILSAKAHGLGYLLAPKTGFNEKVEAPEWVVEGWTWLIHKIRGTPIQKPEWFSLPAMMRFTITTREVLKVLQATQNTLPYTKRAAKPFNFVLSPVLDPLDGYPVGVDPNQFSLIGRYESDSGKWLKVAYVNIHEKPVGKKKPKKYEISTSTNRLPSQALAQSYGNIFEKYLWHTEAKSLGPDELECTQRTEGLLKRVPVKGITPGFIGKETVRRWEKGEDISLLEDRVPQYRPNETAGFCVDHNIQHDAKLFSIRKLAKESGLPENSIKRARRGDRMRKATLEKLRGALNLLFSKATALKNAE